jgi:hypothetical protein
MLMGIAFKRARELSASGKKADAYNLAFDAVYALDRKSGALHRAGQERAAKVTFDLTQRASRYMASVLG